jgi:predicted DNA-binding ribbon-helix-helix protein
MSRLLQDLRSANNPGLGCTPGMQLMCRPVKLSFTIDKHRTSISLEKPFSDALRAAAAEEGMAVAQLVARIDRERNRNSSLSGAVRVWLLRRYRGLAQAARASQAATDEANWRET